MKTFAKFPMEVPIGERIDFEGRILKCTRATKEMSCAACFLYNVSLCRHLLCSGEARTDGKEVYFEKVYNKK